MDPSLIDWSDCCSCAERPVQSPAVRPVHRPLLLPLHRRQRVGEAGRGRSPALQGPPGQQPHGVLGAEQGLRHTLHWRGDHHTRQEDGRHQDHQQGGLRPGNKVDSIFRKKLFLLDILRLIIYGTFHLILSQSNLSEIKCQRNNLYWVGGVWDSLTLSWNEIFYL